jgi:cell division protein FtsB
MPQDEPSAPDAPRGRRRRTAQETRQRRRRALTWGLSLLLCVLLVDALVGDNGYLSTLRTAKEQNALMAELARIRLENEALQAESRRLSPGPDGRPNDPTAVEEAARRQLGFVKPGETLVIVHDTPPAAAPAPATPTPEAK